MRRRAARSEDLLQMPSNQPTKNHCLIGTTLVKLKAYDDLTTKVSMSKLLQSKDRGPNFSGTQSEKVSFSKKDKEYKEGQLKPSDSNQKKATSYPEVENKLLEIDSDESNSVSYVEAVEFLVKLQRTAPKLGVNEAAKVHLERLLKARHSSDAEKARRDTTLRAFGPQSSGFA
jgi:hypothetical protein